MSRGRLSRRWTDGSTVWRTSTASPALAAANVVSAPMRSPATCSDGSFRGSLLQRLPGQRRPALPRRRFAPLEYATRVRLPRRPGRPRQGRRTDPEQSFESAEQRLAEEGHPRRHLPVRNNTDSAGNSYGCHENYLTSRHDDLTHCTEVLIPFPISRQIYAGAGKVLQTAAAPSLHAAAPSTSGRASARPPRGPGRSSTPATNPTLTPTGTGVRT